ncbi:MAG: ROK family protein [Muribaculaceae bacterium]|nr:ROK family protein [Muribaculaceae bacterium]
MTKPYVLGVDIGGTNTVFGIVDARGQVIASDSIKTKKHAEFDDYVAELHTAVERLLRLNDAEDKIQGIGIGAPNANYYTGEIVNPPNLPWGPIIPLAEKVSEAFGGIPVAVTNDANAAALGEMTYGAARGMKDFIMITLGTGVGSGIVINGQMVYGHDGNAGELGHLVMKRNNGRMCGCGRTGCLEAYCSATGVARTAREFLEIRQEPSVLRNIDIEDITSKDVYDAAMAGDKIAKEIFEYTGKILGEAFADMVAFSSPQAIILFGGLAKSGDLLLKPLKEAFEKNVMPIFRGKTQILISELKESDAAVLGASALGWEAKRRSETSVAPETAIQ